MFMGTTLKIIMLIILIISLITFTVAKNKVRRGMKSVLFRTNENLEKSDWKLEFETSTEYIQNFIQPLFYLLGQSHVVKMLNVRGFMNSELCIFHFFAPFYTDREEDKGKNQASSA